jgi:predicted dehydrogenase
MKKKLNVGVVGVGNLGQWHAKNYYELKDKVNLVAIVDANGKRLEKIASQYAGVKYYTDYRDMIDLVDAVSIVVPTPMHYVISKEFLGRGIHCLIEKPITTTLADAEELIRLAQGKKAVLQVGHIERFNPAVLEAQKYIKNPKFIEAYRVGGYDPRVSDIGVILDLMIHDLDIIMFLVNSKVKDLQAYGAKVFSQHEDLAKVRLVFENGCVADITTSRIATGRYRKTRVFTDDSYININYIGQVLRIYRKKTPVVTSMTDIEVIRPKLVRVNQLLIELDNFINCIQEGKQPVVTGEHGRNAVELALEILDKLKIM